MSSSPPSSGRALDANLVLCPPARFTVLSPGLVRLEYAPDGAFTDQPSIFAQHRGQGAQAFEVKRQGQGVEIHTSNFQLTYKGGAFEPANLEIRLLQPGFGSWKPGQAASGNLGGTLRTLDEQWRAVDLGLGLLSREGWSLVDDSGAPVLDSAEQPWISSRPGQGKDWYFFAYGHDYRAALGDLISLGGPLPLPPAYAFGSWYSRYWPYTSQDFLDIAAQYKAQGFPLQVMVIDMDWHQDGWTGFTWNKQLLPDPPKLLQQLHELGLKVTLNLHPHDGVAPHEAAYEAFAKAVGKDPSKRERVSFDVTDPAFMKAYFDLLMHPLEREGVDFWWMDWQQGDKTKVAGLDPLTWLNALHFRDLSRPDNPAFKDAKLPKRGMNFSRWGGWGDHRHPVQFSGDTHSNWEMLEFLPHFTATAGNVGAAYWSHDMGGHFATTGVPDPELFTRWLQFGAFSPILRVHSTRHPDHDRRPWRFGEPFTSALRQAYQLREDLRPYLYTSARQCHDTGLPLVRPMYLGYPQAEEAYHCPGQYLLGPDLLVAPATRPGQGPERVAQVRVWFPEGDWYHLVTHERFQGPVEQVLPLGLADLAVFVRGGAPLPLSGGRVRLYPGPATSRELYEDDGESVGYLQGQARRLPLHSRPEKGGQSLSLGPAQGSFHGAPARRGDWVLEAPLSAKASWPIPGGAWDQAVTVTAPAGFGGADLAPLFRAQRLLHKASLAQAQLPAGHRTGVEAAALVEGLARALDQARQDPSAAALAALEQVEQEASAKASALIRSLVGDAKAAAALGALAGLSLQALAKPGRSPEWVSVEVELRSERPLMDGGLLRLLDEQGLALREAGLEAGKRVLKLELERPVDARALELLKGKVEAELASPWGPLLLEAACDWDARQVREWSVAGPLEKGKGPLPEEAGADVLAGVRYPRLGGGMEPWRHLRFDPAGAQRGGLPPRFEFGQALLCEGGEAYCATVLEAPSSGPCRLRLEAGCEMALWVNGLVLESRDGSAVARLQAGPNQVLLRLRDLKGPGGHGGGFLLCVEEMEGGPSGLRFQPPHPSIAALGRV